MKESDYYTPIATKIPTTDKEKLIAIAKKFDMSFYELLQSLLLALVRYFDEGTMCSEELETMMKAFADVVSSMKGSFNPLSVRGHERQHIRKAIFFIQRKSGQKSQMIEVGKNEHGRMSESYNFDDMLTDFLICFDPKVLKVLRKESKDNGYFSISQALREMILHPYHREQDTITEEVKTLFADVRLSTGQKLNIDDIHYKRLKRNGMDYSNLIPESRYTRADV